MKYFIFDYGHVLQSKIDYELIKNEPSEIAPKYENNEKVKELKDKFRKLYFSGKIETKEYVEDIKQYLNCPNITEQEYIKNFYEIGRKYSKTNPNLDYIIKLIRSKGYKIYVLSNIGENQEEELRKNIKAERFDKVFLSYEMKLIKPEPKIYQKVIKEIEANPKDMYFFDDKEENVIAAIKEGINAYVTDFYKVKEKVEEVINRIDLQE